MSKPKVRSPKEKCGQCVEVAGELFESLVYRDVATGYGAEFAGQLQSGDYVRADEVPAKSSSFASRRAHWRALPVVDRAYFVEVAFEMGGRNRPLCHSTRCGPPYRWEDRRRGRFERDDLACEPRAFSAEGHP